MIAGNIAMVFVFWELVGICSYFLIGFYIERQTATNAANKAFIVNRIGDFGMIVGMCCLLGRLGTFPFGEPAAAPAAFSTRFAPATYAEKPNANAMRRARGDGARRGRERADPWGRQPRSTPQIKAWRDQGFGYGLLILAGLGIFCGCIGQERAVSAPRLAPRCDGRADARVGAGALGDDGGRGRILVGRFYPVFTPEVLLVIAIVGCITLFMAATIAITAMDIKRVLAYSTLSQLGYMMFALGVGGWVAGMLHLITHAFFKSLLFMCSGSVIHAVHTNDMREMGGLRQKMPMTAYTMLVGCLAITGAGLPLVTGFRAITPRTRSSPRPSSGTQSQRACAFLLRCRGRGGDHVLVHVPAVVHDVRREPRNQHVYDHAHESPKVM